MASAGPGEILQLIRQGTVVTRRDIAVATGLSRVTVTQRVDGLRRAGLIHESGSEESTGGRRPARLRFNHDHGLVLTAVLDTSRAELSATNLAGDVVAVHHENIRIADGGQTVLDQLLPCFRELLDRADGASRPVDGIGISLPGPIDPNTGRPSSPPLMPGWDDYDIRGHLQQAFDVPVVVANDANVTALGEQVSHHPDAEVFCLIKVSTGIGCGIVVRGDILAGVDGGAGDIGHIRLDGHDDLCACGSHGCLAAVASGRALVAQLAALGVAAQSASDVRRLVEEGEVLATRAVRQAGRLIGRIASMLVSVVNPAVLVITGDLATPPLLAGIQESLHEFSLPRATRHLRVALGGLGDSAAQVGLTRMVVDTVVDPAAVDRLLLSQQRSTG